MIYEECITRNLLYNSDKIALINDEKEYTYRMIYDYTVQWEKKLTRINVKKGDRVLIVGANTVDTVTLIFACLKIEAIFVPVSHDIHYERLKYIISDCSPKYIYTDNEDIRYLLKKIDNSHIISNPDTITNKYGCIIYTSGSTNFPKGVLEPLSTMMFCVKQINKAIGNKSTDIILSGLPLSFDYGLYQLFLTFDVGATLVLLRDYGIGANIPRLIQKYNITGLPAVPSLIAMMLKSKRICKKKMCSLRYITSTGDNLSINNIKSLKTQLPKTNVIPMYGLTECKRVAIMPCNRWDKILAGSCGLPLENVKIEVHDMKGNKLSAEKIGELVVIGDNIMKGYWNNNEETIKVFLKRNEEQILYTGDLFKFDTEGFLYFCGRKNTFIKRNGYKVSPQEIESFLLSIEGILSSVVIGVPDDIQGESICAFIEIDPQVSLQLNEIYELLNQLPSFMRPDKVLKAHTNFPRNSNGKYDRKKIKKILSDTQK